MTSLAEQLSNLANPAPIFEDPEDIGDETAAKLLTPGTDQDEDGVFERHTQSKLRSRAAALLADQDRKYAGKKTSRQQLQDSTSLGMLQDPSDDDDDDDVESSVSDENDSDSADSDAVDSEEADSEADEGADDVIQSDEEDEQIQGFKEKLKFQDAAPGAANNKFTFSEDGDFSQYADGSEEGSEDGSDVEDESSAESQGSSDGESEEEEEMDVEDGVQQFTKVNVEDEIQKGKSVRAQLHVWDSMLEGRIKLQKAVILANQLPQPEQWQAVVEAGGSEYQTALQESRTFLHKLLEQLVTLQTNLMAQNPETKSLLDHGDSKKKNKSSPKDTPTAVDDDEEITSESDADSDKETSQSEPSVPVLKAKLKMKEYPKFLAKRHSDFRPYRNTTIQKWFDKTRVSSGKLSKGFSAFEQSAVKQIEQILSDRERLVKRTQLKRSAYRVVCKPKEEVEETKEEEVDMDMDTLPSRTHLKDYDEEIFDDDDFYHQQLRELIERKTSDISDPTALSRQWLEIQKLRSKTKKVVDTKGSKGRKIRYNVHSKLVNFMAPVEHSEWTDEARNELYRSLFGKKSAKESTVEAEKS